MVLNRASRKEAETRLGALKRPVTLQVFTLKLEDALCREARTASEEMAEFSGRLAVEIAEAPECGDLIRKYRVDSFPALVASAKAGPELAVYGAPVGYALIALLDAVGCLGAGVEPKAELVSACSDGAASSRTRRADLVVSRRDPAAAEAAAAFWRFCVADWAAGECLRLIPSLRVLEDFPAWAVKSGASSVPCLLLDGAPVGHWPFTDKELPSLFRAASGGV